MSLQAQYKNPGAVLDFTLAAAVSAGEVVRVAGNLLAAVALDAVAANKAGAYYVEGLLNFNKKAALAIAEGDLVYWDDTLNEANLDGDFPVGVCAKAAAAGDSVVYVQLNGRGAAGSGLMVLEATLPGTGTVVLFAANSPAIEIIDFWIVATDNNAGTVKLTDGTSDITNALVHGTTDKAIVRGGTIDDAKSKLAAGSTLDAVVATGGTSKLYVLALLKG